MTTYDNWALQSPPEDRLDDDLEAFESIFDDKVKELQKAGIAFTDEELAKAYKKVADRMADRGDDSIEQVVEDVLDGYGREVEDVAKTN